MIHVTQKHAAQSRAELLEVWRRALTDADPDLSDPLDAVARELEEYFSLSHDEVVRRCRHWEDLSVQEWQAGDRSTPEGLLDFYRTQTSWIFDTLWYHAQQYHGEKPAESVDIAQGLALPPGRHLDFGAGPGSSSLFFHALGWEVALVDVSTTMLEFARWRLARHGVPATFYDATSDPFPPGAFDLITAFDVMVHVPDIAATLRRLHDALRPGGHLVFNIDNQPMTERTAWHLYSEQYPILRQVQSVGFERLPKIEFFHVFRKVVRTPAETRRVAFRDALRHNAVAAAVGGAARRLGLRR